MTRTVRLVSAVALVATVLLIPRPAAAAVTHELAVTPADFTAYGAAACDRLGLSLATGDLNGDGFEDVAVGAPLAQKPGDIQFNRGALHVYFGAAGFSGVRDAAQSGSPDLIVYGEVGRATEICGNKGSDVLGKGVAIGDVNGDGLNDLVVSALRATRLTNQQQVGRVYVFYGRPSWPSVIDLSANAAQADVTIVGDVTAMDLGLHIAVGDLDADGRGDIVAGAPATLDTSKPGYVRVIYGSPSLPATIDLSAPPSGLRTFSVTGAIAAQRLGHGVSVGDLNADGVQDFAAGAPSADETACGTNTGGGTTYVFYGSSSSPLLGTWNLATTPAPFTVPSSEAGDQAGRRLEIGDVSGDGRDDLVIGARCADGPGGRLNAGVGRLLYGPFGMGSRDLSTANASVFGADPDDLLGVAQGIGDLNGDGLGDVILGAEGADGVNNNRNTIGEAFALFGPVSSGTIDLATVQADIRVIGEDPGDALGRFVGAGDLDGDGVDDLVATSYLGRGSTDLSASVGEFVVLTSSQAPELPVVTVSATDANASEPGADTGTFTISRTGGTDSDLLVGYAVTGTAAAGFDYVALSGTVTIPTGSAGAPVTVTVLDDADAEATETVVLMLQNSPSYAIGNPSNATVSIADDDGASSCTITGTPGDDQLQGTNGNDVICGLAGNDTISAGGGNDTIFGGDGNDSINGGAGNDVIFGEAGRDALIGGAGTDQLDGGSDNDRLNSVDQVGGNDTLDGGNASDDCRFDVGDIVTNCP